MSANRELEARVCYMRYPVSLKQNKTETGRQYAASGIASQAAALCRQAHACYRQDIQVLMQSKVLCTDYRNLQLQSWSLLSPTVKSFQLPFNI